MSRILVTGASGFIGTALVRSLVGDGVRVRAASRTSLSTQEAVEAVAIGAMDGATDWRRALDGVSEIIHLAGPAHRRADRDVYRSAVVEATDALAAQAERAGVKRFIFMSSVKAAAERGGPLHEQDAARPGSSYGEAKLEAEQRLLSRSALTSIVLRPPLVHAPHAKANFGALLRLASSGMPLPLAGIANQRSLIALESLVSAIRAALQGPAAPGVYFVADRPAVSTPEMVALLREGMGRPPALFRSPAAALAPRTLRESLVVDDSSFRATFAFAPSLDSHALLRACGAAWARR